MALDTSASGETTVVRRGEVLAVPRGEYWPINWSAIWVGALTSLAVALIISLAGAALGAHELGPAGKIAKWSDVGLGALVFAVVGAFSAGIAGGWVAGKLNGYRHAETDMLNGAIVWLVTIPLLVVLAALGAGSVFGGWYGGLAGVPVWVTPQAVAADPTAAAAARNAALLTITAMLIGLVGSVLGGWLASGESMTVYLRSRRDAPLTNPARRAI